MSITIRHFADYTRFGRDYYKIRGFLLRINQGIPICPNYLWGRFEWLFSLTRLDDPLHKKIGIFEEDGAIVALVTHDMTPGEAYLIADNAHMKNRAQLLEYAIAVMHNGGSLKVAVADDDTHLRQVAADWGFEKTTDSEKVALISTDADLSYNLPNGYSIVSLADEYDIIKYNSVLFKGFNHGDNPPTDALTLDKRRTSLSGPNVNLHLKIAVKSPSGEFVSFCGMWYDPASENALVEPVATVPECRKMGLGKAAVLEGIARCGRLGAKRAYVGSAQQFYYSIGFSPLSVESWWAHTPR